MRKRSSILRGVFAILSVLLLSPCWTLKVGADGYVEPVVARQVVAEAWLKEKNIEVPPDIKTICREKGDEYGISEYMLEALIYRESRFKATAENGPCKGLCQVNTTYFPHNWRDPEANIDTACQVILQIVDQYGAEDLGDILSYYHGEGKPGYSGYTKGIDEISVKLMEADGVY